MSRINQFLDKVSPVPKAKDIPQPGQEPSSAQKSNQDSRLIKLDLYILRKDKPYIEPNAHQTMGQVFNQMMVARNYTIKTSGAGQRLNTKSSAARLSPEQRKGSQMNLLQLQSNMSESCTGTKKKSMKVQDCLSESERLGAIGHLHQPYRPNQPTLTEAGDSITIDKETEYLKRRKQVLLQEQNAEKWNKLPVAFKRVVELHSNEQVARVDQLINLKNDNKTLKSVIKKRNSENKSYSIKTKAVRRQNKVLTETIENMNQETWNLIKQAEAAQNLLGVLEHRTVQDLMKQTEESYDHTGLNRNSQSYRRLALINSQPHKHKTQYPSPSRMTKDSKHFSNKYDNEVSAYSSYDNMQTNPNADLFNKSKNIQSMQTFENGKFSNESLVNQDHDGNVVMINRIKKLNQEYAKKSLNPSSYEDYTPSKNKNKKYLIKQKAQTSKNPSAATRGDIRPQSSNVLSSIQSQNKGSSHYGNTIVTTDGNIRITQKSKAYASSKVTQRNKEQPKNVNSTIRVKSGNRASRMSRNHDKRNQTIQDAKEKMLFTLPSGRRENKMRPTSGTRASDKTGETFEMQTTLKTASKSKTRMTIKDNYYDKDSKGRPMSGVPSIKSQTFVIQQSNIIVKDQDEESNTKRLTPIVDINSQNETIDVKYAKAEIERQAKSRGSLISGNTTAGLTTSIDPISFYKNKEMKRLQSQKNIQQRMGENDCTIFDQESELAQEQSLERELGRKERIIADLQAQLKELEILNQTYRELQNIHQFSHMNMYSSQQFQNKADNKDLQELFFDCILSAIKQKSKVNYFKQLGIKPSSLDGSSKWTISQKTEVVLNFITNPHVMRILYDVMFRFQKMSNLSKQQTFLNDSSMQETFLNEINSLSKQRMSMQSPLRHMKHQQMFVRTSAGLGPGPAAPQAMHQSMQYTFYAGNNSSLLSRQEARKLGLQKLLQKHIIENQLNQIRMSKQYVSNNGQKTEFSLKQPMTSTNISTSNGLNVTSQKKLRPKTTKTVGRVIPSSKNYSNLRVHTLENSKKELVIQPISKLQKPNTDGPGATMRIQTHTNPSISMKRETPKNLSISNAMQQNLFVSSNLALLIEPPLEIRGKGGDVGSLNSSKEKISKLATKTDEMFSGTKTIEVAIDQENIRENGKETSSIYGEFSQKQESSYRDTGKRDMLTRKGDQRYAFSSADSKTLEDMNQSQPGLEGRSLTQDQSPDKPLNQTLDFDESQKSQTEDKTQYLMNDKSQTNDLANQNAMDDPNDATLTFQNRRDEHKQRQQELLDEVQNLRGSNEAQSKEGSNLVSPSKLVYTDHSPLAGAKLTLEDYNKGQQSLFDVKQKDIQTISEEKPLKSDQANAHKTISKVIGQNYQVGELNEKSEERKNENRQQNVIQQRSLNRRSIQLSHSKSQNHMGSDNESLNDNAYQNIPGEESNVNIHEMRNMNKQSFQGLSGVPTMRRRDDTKDNTIHTESAQNIELPAAKFEIVKQGTNSRTVITPNQGRQGFNINEIYQFEQLNAMMHNMHQVIGGVSINDPNNSTAKENGGLLPQHFYKKQEPTYDIHIIAPKRPNSSAYGSRASKNSSHQRESFNILKNLKQTHGEVIDQGNRRKTKGNMNYRISKGKLMLN